MPSILNFWPIYTILVIISVFLRKYLKKMVKLSVNINKIATIRNARGGNMPDVLKAATDCQTFGAEGITVHPRPDERHIRYADALAITVLPTRTLPVKKI